MKSKLFNSSFKVLVFITTSMLLILISSLIVIINNYFSEVKFGLNQKTIQVVLVSILICLCFTFNSYLKKKVFLFFKSKEEKENLYSSEQIEELESEAEYIKRAKENFINHER
jgi:magnesium-transporting ATPase (P-type)